MAVGLILVVALMAVMAAMVWRHNLAGHKLADSRAALRLAERTLAELHSGGPVAQARGVQVRRLSAGPVAGTHWVEVQAIVDGRSATLVGLVAEPRDKEPTP